MTELTTEEAAVLLHGVATEDGVYLKRATGLKAQRHIKPDDLKVLVEGRGMKWDDSLIDRHVSYWASDERPDSDKEIVIQDWDFSRFEKNSPLCLMHNWQGFPLGRVVDWNIENRNEKGYKGKALKLEAVFATGDETAERVFRLVNQGVLVSGSCGFVSKSVTRLSKEDAEKKGADKILSKNFLIEFSPCMIGANPGAMVAKSPGDINLLRELTRLELVRGSDDVQRWSTKELEFLALGKRLFPGCEFEPHTELDTPIPIVDPHDRMKALELQMVAVHTMVTDIRSILEKAPVPSDDERLAKELKLS